MHIFLSNKSPTDCRTRSYFNQYICISFYQISDCLEDESKDRLQIFRRGGRDEDVAVPVGDRRTERQPQRSALAAPASMVTISILVNFG